MSLFGSLFSSKPDYPAMDPTSAAASRIAAIKSELGELAGQVKDPLEVVPAEDAAFVFIGKPPKRFGLAWIHDGKVDGLNAIVEENGLKPLEVQQAMEQLRDAYERNSDVDRFLANVEDRDLVVTPSASLGSEVHQIIDGLVHH